MPTGRDLCGSKAAAVGVFVVEAAGTGQMTLTQCEWGCGAECMFCIFSCNKEQDSAKTSPCPSQVLFGANLSPFHVKCRHMQVQAVVPHLELHLARLTCQSRQLYDKKGYCKLALRSCL